MKNSRFWIYANEGPVKITLKPGQSLEYMTGGQNEEGWSREWCKWEYEDGIVYREWANEGTDCDGRHGNYGKDECHVENLLEGNHPYIADGDLDAWDGVVWPAWQEESRRNYDQYAEMAGY